MIGDFSYKLNRVQRPLAAIADGAKRKFIHARISCLSWLKRLLFQLLLEGKREKREKKRNLRERRVLLRTRPREHQKRDEMKDAMSFLMTS